MAMERTFDAMMAADASDDQDISGCYAWVMTMDHYGEMVLWHMMNHFFHVFSTCWEASSQPTKSYFSEGERLNHQADGSPW